MYCDWLMINFGVFRVTQDHVRSHHPVDDYFPITAFLTYAENLTQQYDKMDPPQSILLREILMSTSQAILFLYPLVLNTFL